MALLRGHAEIKQYLDKLLLSDRADRAGFPPEAMKELFALRMLRDELHPKLLQQQPDVWTSTLVR